MNLNRHQFPLERGRNARNGYVVNMVLLVVFSAVAVLYLYLNIQTPVWQLFALAGLMLMAALASAVGLRMTRNDRAEFGVGLAVLVILIVLPVSSLLARGLGIYFGIVQLIGISIAVGLSRLRRNAILLSTLNFASSILTALLDAVGSPNRIALPIVPSFASAIVVLVLTILAIVVLREFRNFGLQTKITIGILFTGGMALGILAVFAFSRTGTLIGTFSNRFENQVNLLAKEQLTNIVSGQANKVDNSLSITVSQVQSLVNQLASLQAEKDTLGKGLYWNAEDKLLQLSHGQYTNTLGTPSSVFVPSFVTLDDALIQELNTTAYLDFSAPHVLKNNLQMRAVYYTDPKGAITYYPNVWLSANVPHDYNATEESSYRIASPLFDPQRAPRWTIPRHDPAGVGLIVSVSIPVYANNKFSGVMTADFRLNSIADDIKSIKVGQTGYAFLIDSDGHIISMPPQGYQLFDLVPEVIAGNAEPKQTIFDGDIPFELQQVTGRMVVGGSGILSIKVNGIDNLIAFAPVANNHFSLGLIVPKEEMIQAVIATRQEINSQIQNALRNAVFILIVLLSGAILISFILGQLIASPIRRLTQTANQILEGDLTAQAAVTTSDETGTLAQAFNAMTNGLRSTLAGLEKTIQERTSELVNANQSNQRRAKQFQSIAQVARTISSTLNLDSLLTQITMAISREFGFYHVGVFLLDTAGEYAVLSAANSEGGQVMLARGHRLKVGEKGLVGFVSSIGRPRVALDTGADAVFFNNPDLPETRSEVALPLRAGEAVIGVLDVQSREPSAFTQDDVAILSTLADQVSIAIQNARQNDSTQKALAESESLSRQFVRSGWSQFTKKQNLLGVRHTGAKSTILYLRKARGKDDTLQITGQLKPRGRGEVLSFPIQLRGQVIGSVDVRAPDNRRWDQDEKDIVSAIIERAAIAMENARLLAESQKRAAKERTIGEISAKISAQSEVDELLKIAAQELNRTLPDTEVAIQLRKEETE